jgi:hypothetical protein
MGCKIAAALYMKQREETMTEYIETCYSAPEGPSTKCHGQLAPPREYASLDTGGKHVRRVGYSTLLSASLTVPVLVIGAVVCQKQRFGFTGSCYKYPGNYC